MPSGWIIIQPICEDNFMKFLADENFPLKSVHILQESGIDIKSIAIENSGITDVDVLQFALGEKRTLLTFDRDFGELVFKLGIKPQNGILYFRWDSFQPHDPANFLLEILTQKKITLTGFFTVVGKDSIRQRKIV
jgi:predicted nuclease of predicted toxin-antitoxin system